MRSAALDDLLLPLMDEAEWRKVLVSRAVSRGDVDAAASLASQQSARAKLAANELSEVTLLGDVERAAALQERLAVLLAIRADTTQDEGSYSAYLDKDEDYEVNRRRIMGS